MMLSRFLRTTTAAGMLLSVGACFSYDGCNIDWDDCDSDADCAPGTVCVEAWLGRICDEGRRCTNDGDCIGGETCVLQAGREADQPFERDQPSLSICRCESFDCYDETTSSSSTTSTSSSSQGGGGQGGGGQGGSGQGGGGQGGSGQGGGGGQGGMGGGN